MKLHECLYNLQVQLDKASFNATAAWNNYLINYMQPFVSSTTMIDKDKCTPTESAVCNSTTEYKYHSVGRSPHPYMISAVDLSDYLCFVNSTKFGYNVTTFYDKSSFISKYPTPSKVRACDTVIFNRASNTIQEPQVT